MRSVQDSLIREDAITFAVGVLRHAKDWQEAQHALADHGRFGPWLREADDEVEQAGAIIREAEERLGDESTEDYLARQRKR